MIDSIDEKSSQSCSFIREVVVGQDMADYLASKMHEKSSTLSYLILCSGIIPKSGWYLLECTKIIKVGEKVWSTLFNGRNFAKVNLNGLEKMTNMLEL